MTRIKFFSRICYISIVFVLIAAGFYPAPFLEKKWCWVYPVFALEMKSRNYHLELESSDAQAIYQDFLNEFNKDTGLTETENSFISNYKLLTLLKIVTIGGLLTFLTILIFKRNKKNV